MGTFITHFLFHFLRIVFTVFLATLSLFLGSLSAARFLHNDLLNKIMRAPMAWFDVTPAGRIINRISHDVSEIDNDLPATLRAWASCIFSVYLFETTKHTSINAPFIFSILPIGCLNTYFDLFPWDPFSCDLMFLFFTGFFISISTNSLREIWWILQLFL